MAGSSFASLADYCESIEVATSDLGVEFCLSQVKGRALLGRKEKECPQELHAAMEAHAAAGIIPTTTLARRIQVRASTTAVIGVPEHMRAWRDWGYIHPVLPAPAGFRGKWQNKVWTLSLRGG